MADCFPPEADDLHRRWLPREIFADIGIVDTEPVPDAPPEAAGVEELAAQLAGILGGGSKVRRLPPPPPPPVAAPRHGAQVSARGAPRSDARGLRPAPGVLLGFAAPDKVPGVRLQVCGLEGSAVAACGGANGVGAGAAAVAWPFVPYPPAQWQGGSNLVNLGGVLDYYYSAFPPAPPCPVPPPANLRGGTGVFIPRTACALSPAPAKGGIATRAWPGTGGTCRPATGRKQEWQQDETPTTQLRPQEETPTHACPRPELTLLPQDWSYR
ncbi:hypothetical protein PVAP13_3NG021900 [Panicum virgatum]|uniref:Uncharacterized protein n=1 Tax=Panicum virgatum TaxID=38727 RepID=A0A8T0TSF5_PANVG|nr:hypothetical protein PVAP13_3NG021900 [Panicum virgatum]